MGERSRRDRAGHQQNAETKGHPTPKAPQNAPPSVPGTPPPTRAVAWVMGANAQVGPDRHVEGEILSLHIVIPAGVLTLKLPLEHWGIVADVVAGAIAEHGDEAARAASKLHLPHGVDLEAEARAHDQIRKGPDRA